MTPFDALYGCSFRTPVCKEEVGTRSFHAPTIIADTIEKVKKVQERLKISQSKQKSYANNHRRKLEFQLGDWVFLKASLMKGIIRFGK